jgi:hypothetical protein
MRLTWDEIVVWLIVGALAGALVGMVVTRKREGFGHWANLGIGLVGGQRRGPSGRLHRRDDPPRRRLAREKEVGRQEANVMPAMVDGAWQVHARRDGPGHGRHLRPLHQRPRVMIE